MDAPDRRDLVVAVLWAAATATLVALSDNTLLRVALGVPTALLLPGHALIRAMGVRTCSMLEHAVYSVGASLAAAVAGGLALNTLDLLTPLGWAIWFLAVTTMASLVATRRRNAHKLPSWPRPAGLRPPHVIAFAFAAVVATTSYALAIRDEAMQREFKFTEFWILPSAAGDWLALGVRNAEDRTLQFDVDVTVDGRPFAAFQSLVIAPGELWTREMPVPQRTVPQTADARLYQLKDHRLYRQVSALISRTERRGAD